MWKSGRRIMRSKHELVRGVFWTESQMFLLLLTIHLHPLTSWFFSLFFSVSSLQEMRVQGVAAKQVFKKAEWSHWKCFTVNSLILKVAGTRVVYIALFINNIFEVQQQNWIFVEKNIVLREESCRAFVKVFPYVAQSYKEVMHLSCFLF